ncbi:MAG TPA: hypothetical protein DCE41_03790 [Cytophagales bacterium]|nr:hypothetical protein [Cytophagales bacterium]HAA21195.1 hypothetical protein [Cytophagales bacterium]HAP62108.1 hypothetical protein [Cytophagales bacterium]
MCTVTYLPLRNGGYILTTNRDESPNRAPVKFPYSHQVYGKEIIYPQDGESGGSWIGATDFGLSAVIMNGAHAPHVRRPPYRMSRGQVLVDALECIRPQEFVKNYDFSGVEPFTLLMIYDDRERAVMEMRWDGENQWQKFHHPASPHIWAANMLYDEHAQQLRKKWFKEWLDEKPEFSQENIMKFHYEAGAEDPYNAMRMNRQNRVATISTTSLLMSPGHCNMHYHDLRKNTKSELVFQELPSSMYAYVYDQN